MWLEPYMIVPDEGQESVREILFSMNFGGHKGPASGQKLTTRFFFQDKS